MFEILADTLCRDLTAIDFGGRPLLVELIRKRFSLTVIFPACSPKSLKCVHAVPDSFLKNLVSRTH